MYASSDQPSLNVRTVVYATDFSPCSENAGTFARLLALHFQTSLIITHAFTISQPAMEVEAERKLESVQRRDLEHLLLRKVVALSSSSLGAIPALLEGDPRCIVPEFAEAHAPCMIVLGTHGGGRIERGIIGSVAEAILRSTRWPCLTVGPESPSLSSSSTVLPFGRVLFATDFTPAAAHAIVFGLALVETCGKEIDVLNVVPERAIEHPDQLAEIRSRFYDALDLFVPAHAKDFSHPRTFVDTGNVHDRILEHIRDRSIDLLVLGIRKTSHLGLEMRMSGAFRIIAEALCPVLTITG